MIEPWFVTSKIVVKFYNVLFAENNLHFIDEHSGNATFISDEMRVLSINLNDVNLDHVNVDEGHPKTLFMQDIWLSAID